ncbi:hypothetical protein F383_36251 [Gossypium arboreum]|uniref:Uncharacterized protein n=1 Tax=Gossypium arboreum TaxID=29729 RepID=A0A0B0NAK0_GOSAR|nr:hypothetical protein F383_36251 [Gossypium arboreum]
MCQCKTMSETWHWHV